MPPRKSSRANKSTAPSPAPLSHLKSEKAHDTLEKSVEETGIDVEIDNSEFRTDVKGKGKAVAQDIEEDVESRDAATTKVKKPSSAIDRAAKLKELRMRMNQGTQDNRKSLIEDRQKAQTTARELARLEKQRKLAENLREKINAAEDGTDLERKKHWKWSVEQNEDWEKKMAAKKEKSNFEFDDRDSNAQRAYDRDTLKLKPDLMAYNRQKEAALGLAPGSIVPVEAQKIEGRTGRIVAAKSKTAEEFYGDSSTLSYGDNKPSDDAIDRVVGKINEDTERRYKAWKKRKAGDDDGDVTYINEANKVFNKKINRYFDKYTTEIRANFERGTAL